MTWSVHSYSYPFSLEIICINSLHWIKCSANKMLLFLPGWDHFTSDGSLPFNKHLPANIKVIFEFWFLILFNNIWHLIQKHLIQKYSIQKHSIQKHSIHKHFIHKHLICDIQCRNIWYRNICTRQLIVLTFFQFVDHCRNHFVLWWVPTGDCHWLLTFKEIFIL